MEEVAEAYLTEWASNSSTLDPIFETDGFVQDLDLVVVSGRALWLLGSWFRWVFVFCLSFVAVLSFSTLASKQVTNTPYLRCYTLHNSANQEIAHLLTNWWSFSTDQSKLQIMLFVQQRKTSKSLFRSPSWSSLLLNLTSVRRLSVSFQLSRCSLSLSLSKQ